MNLKTTVAAALLAIGAAGSAFAGVTPYPNAGTQNPTTYTFTSNGGDVMAYFMGSSASYNESLGLLINGVDSGITGLQNHSTAVGESLDFGTIAAGMTLTFYINVATTGDVFYSDKGLNSDGVNHVYSTDVGASGGVPAGTYVAFEDLKGGGDLNYHDETFVFTNVGTVTPSVPEPANLALLMSGLGLMGFVARRRRG
jgi:Domain of unknown function (DUF4114)/PEP-CTERM motif